ncbi:sensory box histidine kinase [Myxococcus xanthus DK 1622]|uniref:histidine kinase n=2 Tax=Myxococcaceae TaxID=31 RepID=Q1DFF2_MYXXD|nr:sensory box histidine kinase [Myxococcus xanthus DK 1622]NOJ53103.1 PAS domain S-box protein [Myxococcus xanthus]QPM80065.1 PAS domain S-box protein [Myxococcus xanthus]QVW69129.1 PAS domain S-box protein [Myxococcus xanthus DZ2]UEO04743.1 PAS domain S-box protein [Myxococcus xanthus DZ2]
MFRRRRARPEPMTGGAPTVRTHRCAALASDAGCKGATHLSLERLDRGPGAGASREEPCAFQGDATMNECWRPQRRSAAMARGIAWLATLGAPLVGALYLLGWAWDVEMLRPGVAGIPMTPVTGIAMIFGGAALGLRLRARPFRHQESTATACALVMVVIGAVSLLRDITGWDVGMEHIMLRLLDGHASVLPLPSPLSATCLTLLGAALALPERSHSVRLRDTLVVLSLVTSTLGLNGLLMGPLLTVGTLPFLAERSMGLPTALTLMLLAVGTLCAWPGLGLMGRITRDSLGGFLARRLVPVTLLGPSVLGMVLMLLHEVRAINLEAKLPIFATFVSAGGAALVLLSARALDHIEAHRQQATAALEASEARYRGLLETTPAPLLTVDAQGLLRFVNTEAERVFGYPREELLGREVEVLVPEGLFGGRSLDTGLGERAIQGRRKDGSPLSLEVRLSPVSGPEGPSVLAVVRDVSERERYLSKVQRAREEAEMQRSQVQALLDHTPVGIVFAEADGGGLVANPVAEQLLGRPLKGVSLAMTGINPVVLTTDGKPARREDVPIVRALLTGQLAGPEEFLILHPDGSRLPVLMTAAPVFGPSGKVRGVVSTAQDVTTRHELDRLREEYVSLISHDLRNPLHTISLRVGLLRRALREQNLEREESMTEAIQRSVAWMNTMIEDLLEGSRLESQRETLRREPRDLARFLEEVMERDVAPDVRERFHLEVPGALPPIWMDAARLERVMANLLSNAAKYSPGGQPITVRAQLQPEQVVVSVKDLGPGLSPEDAARVFDKYFRTQKSGASDAKGLGLGLYISRLIIEAHGGRIWVESEPGQGSTFSFSLPVAPPGANPLPPQVPDDQAPAAGDGSAVSA